MARVQGIQGGAQVLQEARLMGHKAKLISDMVALRGEWPTGVRRKPHEASENGRLSVVPGKVLSFFFSVFLLMILFFFLLSGFLCAFVCDLVS